MGGAAVKVSGYIDGEVWFEAEIPDEVARLNGDDPASIGVMVAQQTAPSIIAAVQLLIDGRREPPPPP